MADEPVEGTKVEPSAAPVPGAPASPPPAEDKLPLEWLEKGLAVFESLLLLLFLVPYAALLLVVSPRTVTRRPTWISNRATLPYALAMVGGLLASIAIRDGSRKLDLHSAHEAYLERADQLAKVIDGKELLVQAGPFLALLATLALLGRALGQQLCGDAAKGRAAALYSLGMTALSLAAIGGVRNFAAHWLASLSSNPSWSVRADIEETIAELATLVILAIAVTCVGRTAYAFSEGSARWKRFAFFLAIFVLTSSAMTGGVAGATLLLNEKPDDLALYEHRAMFVIDGNVRQMVQSSILGVGQVLVLRNVTDHDLYLDTLSFVSAYETEDLQCCPSTGNLARACDEHLEPDGEVGSQHLLKLPPNVPTLLRVKGLNSRACSPKNPDDVAAANKGYCYLFAGRFYNDSGERVDAFFGAQSYGGSEGPATFCNPENWHPTLLDTYNQLRGAGN